MLRYIYKWLVLKTTRATDWLRPRNLKGAFSIKGQWKLSAYTLYTCVWLRLKDLHGEEMATLQQHWSMLARYRFATQEELDEHDDVCAVCLCPMRFARITPCQHVFHGDCLRRCLQASDLCPLCKRQFKFE